MKCKYLKKKRDPLTSSKPKKFQDSDKDEPSAIWLCMYDKETRGPLGLINHCLFKFGPHEKCLFENKGGPFEPGEGEEGESIHEGAIVSVVASGEAAPVKKEALEYENGKPKLTLVKDEDEGE